MQSTENETLYTFIYHWKSLTGRNIMKYFKDWTTESFDYYYPCNNNDINQKIVIYDIIGKIDHNINSSTSLESMIVQWIIWYLYNSKIEDMYT